MFDLDQILGFYPLISSIVLLMLVITLCFVNMYLLARYRKSFFTIMVHIGSFFVASGLIFYIVAHAIFAIPLSRFYARLAETALWTAVVICAAGFGYIAVNGKKNDLRVLPFSITEVLQNIEDVVFVIDTDGIITHINHPALFQKMFGRIDTLEQLERHLQVSCFDTDRADGVLPDTGELYKCEGYFESLRMYAAFQIAPIMSLKGKSGYMIVIEDVTKVRESEGALFKQNESLRNANERLGSYIKAAGQLEAEKERLVILKRIQETLLQDIEGALSLIQGMKRSAFQDESYAGAMTGLASVLRSTYQKVRNAVSQIAGKGENV
ncbi:MAG TPA: hypothetical protein PLU43_00060 [Lachnospiraceae bacterium]|nr:hypothetical protein [Lachnospiraceae bacterium]